MTPDKIFQALGSYLRRKILAYLAENELTNSELAERFGISAPSMSRHLSVLENAGLVASRRVGQHVLYSLNSESLVNTLLDYAFEILPVGAKLRREGRALARKHGAAVRAKAKHAG
jgi:DNA-binding transcriptional ArsR family regulator